MDITTACKMYEYVLVKAAFFILNLLHQIYLAIHWLITKKKRLNVSYKDVVKYVLNTE
jgi:hypothetical protein